MNIVKMEDIHYICRGIKRNERLFDGIDPYKVDITEIDGFDNLHNPKKG